LLRIPADTAFDRVLRWAAVFALIAVVGLRVAGRLG
jgi:hypothetical protein